MKEGLAVMILVRVWPKRKSLHSLMLSLKLQHMGPLIEGFIFPSAFESKLSTGMKAGLAALILKLGVV